MQSLVLTYPRNGIYNRVYRPWLPLSLLAAVSILRRDGFDVRLIDTRLGATWREELREALGRDPLCLGITAMTGSQIRSALEVSAAAREMNKRVPIVWGGIHPTLFPEQTLKHTNVDAVVLGEGEVAFHELAKAFRDRKSCEGIAGAWTKSDGEIRTSPRGPFLDLNELPELPFELVDVRRYLHRFFSEDGVVEVETSRGCPYGCRFCYNPLANERSFRAYRPERVLAQFRRLARQFGARAFHVVDDAFFADLPRARDILEGIAREALPVRVGFQGVRIDTIESMSDVDLDLLVRAGGRFLQVGVESGSSRILELIDKRIEPGQVLEQNRRLARYPGLIPLYNFMCGFPTETRQDILASAELASRILDENPNAIVSPFHHYKSYPGTRLYEVQETHGILRAPQTLEEWSSWDWTESTKSPRRSGTGDLLRRVEVVSIFADRKMAMLTDFPLWIWLARIYRPLARARLRRGFYAFMPERWLLAAYGWLQKRRQ